METIMSLATNTIASLNTRLDSEDPKVVYAAAIEAFVKSSANAETVHVLAKAVVRVDASSTSRRQWLADIESKGSVIKSATASNYANAWALAAKCADGAEPLPIMVWHAYRIVCNVKVANRDRWIATMPETGRPEWLADGFANYKTIGEPVQSLNTDPEPEVTPEPEVVVPEAPSVDGKLSVLSGIASQIAAGSYSVEDAYRLAQAAKDIILAAEAFVAAAAAVETVAA